MKRDFAFIEAEECEEPKERMQETDVTPEDVSEQFVCNDIYFS